MGLHPKIILQKQKAFTLIELLVVVGVIVILTAFFVSASADLQERSKITKTKHSLTQIANGIKSFEQDWGQLPSSTTDLISPKALIDLATSKKMNMPSAKPYLTGLPELDGFMDVYRYFCPDYLSNPSTYALHAHDLTYAQYSSSPQCPCVVSTSPTVLCMKSLTWAVFFEPDASQPKRIADPFGNLVYYLTKSDGSYLLISPGPDGKISGSAAVLKKMYNNDPATANAYNDKSTDPLDKDNIIFKSNG